MTGQYSSPEKNKIRTALWDRAFNDYAKIEKGLIDDLRYFCMPSAECIYEKHLVANRKLTKRNIVSVEKDYDLSIPIREFLGGEGIHLEDSLENLTRQDKLLLFSPFDIVNLDFCGQAFVFSGQQYQQRWSAIEYFFKKNYEKRKSVFYLLLTIFGGRSSSVGKQFLLDKITQLNDITGLGKNPTSWKEDRLIQEVLPSIIVDMGLKHNYYTGSADIEGYRYRQTGHRCNMVAFYFKFRLLDPKLGSSTIEKNNLFNAALSYYQNDAKELTL